MRHCVRLCPGARTHQRPRVCGTGNSVAVGISNHSCSKCSQVSAAQVWSCFLWQFKWMVTSLSCPPSLVSERDLLVAAVMLNREVDKTCEGEESPPRGRGRNGRQPPCPRCSSHSVHGLEFQIQILVSPSPKACQDSLWTQPARFARPTWGSWSTRTLTQQRPARKP